MGRERTLWRRLIALSWPSLSACSALCSLRPRSASTDDIIAPQHPPYNADQRLAGRTCTKDSPDLLGRHPEQFFEHAAGHPRSASPSSSSSTRTGGRSAETPVGELKTVHVDLPGRPQRQPAGDAAVPAGDLRSRRRGCPADSKVGESFVTASVPLLGPIAPIAGVTQVPVYNVEPPKSANRPASASNSPATKSSSKPTSPGTATTTRASRSTSPKVPSLGPLSKG